MIPNVLAIAGSDSSGGAGIQADLKTFAAFDVYGCAAITAITVQNAHSVRAVTVLPAELVAGQIAAVFDGAPVDAVKIGMLGDAHVARAVASSLRGRHPMPGVVLDPVLRASAGTVLLDRHGVGRLRDDLLPLAAVITPNAYEAGVLLAAPPPASLAGMRHAARALCALGPRWALVTGGHVDAGDDCVDVLSNGTETHELRTPRVPGRSRHGTGCTLSSAIAALLALGRDVPAACAIAQRYVGAAMTAGTAIRVTGEVVPLRHLAFSYTSAAAVGAARPALEEVG